MKKEEKKRKDTASSQKDISAGKKRSPSVVRRIDIRFDKKNEKGDSRAKTAPAA